MSWLKKLEKSLCDIIEISLLLISLGIVIEILFGDAVPLMGRVDSNLIKFLSTLGENGIFGLIVAGIIIFLFYRTIGLPVTNTHKGQTRRTRKGAGRRTKQARKTS